MTKQNPSDTFSSELWPHMDESRPVLRPFPFVQTIPYAFVIHGEAGNTERDVLRVTNGMFKPQSLFAIDTAPRCGSSTQIQVRFGATAAFPQPVPVWAFSGWIDQEERETYETLAKLVGTKHETAEARKARDLLKLANAAAAFEHPVLYPGMDITIEATFTETGRVEGVIWGKELS